MRIHKSAFTDIFIRRPVLALVVNLVILIAGIQAYKSLNVRQYPRNENAIVTIQTIYFGADADLVRGFITTPIERAIASADGIDYIESTSTQGVSTVTAVLKLNYDGNQALSEISTKVDTIRGDLPPESEVPILSMQTADSEFAAAYLSFNSANMAPNEVTDYLVRVVQPRLSAVKGVQKADILGGQTFAMRIWLKTDKMAALNVSASEIRNVLTANNYLSAVGQTKGSYISINLTANTDLRTAEEFKKMVVREENGAIIRLEDVADVVLGAESYDFDIRFSGEEAVFMGIWVLPNANTLSVIHDAREELERIKKDLPLGMVGGIAYDSTEYIEDAIHEVYKTLGETLLIVVIVIFLFLGSFRSVLVPVMAIPISLIGALFLMQMFGFTINLLTLLAIVLSVGLVVDDAIVAVENVERHLRMGQKPVQAALAASRELVGPIIAMTLTLASVYAPIGLQGGLTGVLFKEFAFTLAGAVLISGIVALTLSPMMASKMLREDESERGLAGRISRGFEWFKGQYGKLLDVILANRPFVYVIALILILMVPAMFQQSTRELAPAEDQGIIFGILDTPSNSTIEQTVHSSEQIFDAFASVDEFNYSFQITFPTGGFGGTILTPWTQRDRTTAQILPEVQGKVDQVPGLSSFMVIPPALPSGGGAFPVNFVIASTASHEKIMEFAEQLQMKAAQSGKFFFPPPIDMKFDLPQVEIKIDHDKVADLGLNLRQVGADMASALGGGYVNRFSIDGRSYRVIPQLKRSERLNPDQLLDVYIRGPEGKLIPLSTVATLEKTVQPRSLNRFQQLNAVTLSGVVPSGTLDDALKFMEEEAAKILPGGYSIDYKGESRQLRYEGGDSKFFFTMILASLLIFLVLAVQFNSFRDPFVILVGSVPLAMFGALVFTSLKMPNPNLPFWTDGWTTSFNIYTQVGLVTLVGLISKNGILIVEFANQLQREGRSKLEAVREAAVTRFRPVLMTTCATVFGHFPLVLVNGPGAEARNSIGLVLVGGMAIGTVFTLFVVPSLYMLIAKKHREILMEEPKVLEGEYI
ncbi:MAG: efflux RND transporter permease subunit [Opitutales bacterium]|nr:efflux RND transporter permease subunit [Opitutales bacterium]